MFYKKSVKVNRKGRSLRSLLCYRSRGRPLCYRKRSPTARYVAVAFSLFGRKKHLLRNASIFPLVAKEVLLRNATLFMCPCDCSPTVFAQVQTALAPGQTYRARSCSLFTVVIRPTAHSKLACKGGARKIFCKKILSTTFTRHIYYNIFKR